MTKKAIALAGGVVVLGFAAYLIGQNKFSSAEDNIASQINKTLQSPARKINYSFEVLVPQDSAEGSSTVSSAFSVQGDGWLKKTGDNYDFDGKTEIRTRRQGLGFFYSFLIRSVKGDVYLNVAEMPATKELKRELYGKWLALGNYGENIVSVKEKADFLNALLGNPAIAEIKNSGNDVIEGSSAVRYDVILRQDEAKKFLEDLVSKAQSEGDKKEIQYLINMLKNFSVEKMNYWTVNKNSEFAGISFELTPMDKKVSSGKIAVKLNLHPFSGDIPQWGIPEQSQKFNRPDLLWRLVAAGIR